MNSVANELRKLAAKGTYHPVSQSDKASRLWDEGQRQLALAIMRHLAKDNPGNGEIWLTLGYFYLKMEMPRFALMALKKAAALLPFNQFTLGLQACALESLGRHAEADSFHARALELESWRKEPGMN